MKRPVIRTRAGQMSWLQVLALIISGVAYVTGNMMTALIMLLVATLFGVAAMITRFRDAQRNDPELFRALQQRRRRR